MSASERYAALEGERQPYIDRARACAKVTIPALIRDEGKDGSSKLDTPYQSIGARGVNNLASKLLLSLFPPHTPPFTLPIDSVTRQEMTQREGMQGEVDQALKSIVDRVQNDIETRGVRTSVFEIFKHGIVAGNALLYAPPGGGNCRVYALTNYVIKRSPDGTLLEIVIKEKIAHSALPPEIKNAIPTDKLPEAPENVNGKPSVPVDAQNKEHDLFTHIFLSDGQYHIHQEIENITVPGSEGSFLPVDMPYIPHRFVRVDGESYGRSYCEEYLGDLASLEDLSKAILEFTAIAARVNPLINPSGVTSVNAYMKAANGAPLVGKAGDVTFAQVDKYNDMRSVMDYMKEIEKRLAFAFLLNTSIQRGGDRVTAEEIRFMARELEDALGGIYSIQSQEFQLPMVLIFIKQSGMKIPKQITLKVVTGMDALGKGQDLANLDAFVMGIVKVAPQAASAVNWNEYMTRRANALNVEITGLIKSPEEQQAEAQQAQMAQMAQQGLPNAINQAGQMAQKSMENRKDGE